MKRICCSIRIRGQPLNGMLQVVRTVYSPEAGHAAGIAFWAHIGGFIAGALLVWPFVKSRRQIPQEDAAQD
ncbi:MAG TPA: rhomboid family intramembrane serine protease [Tepidisphaeraceae bacterium]|jgi:membrane associated rhomboid family serine protease|nr:rhomboid family intramembrane serine protease [Tepidisphaeraceae bacterium]